MACERGGEWEGCGFCFWRVWGHLALETGMCVCLVALFEGGAMFTTKKGGAIGQSKSRTLLLRTELGWLVLTLAHETPISFQRDFIKAVLTGDPGASDGPAALAATKILFELQMDALESHRSAPSPSGSQELQLLSTNAALLLSRQILSQLSPPSLPSTP